MSGSPDLDIYFEESIDDGVWTADESILIYIVLFSGGLIGYLPAADLRLEDFQLPPGVEVEAGSLRYFYDVGSTTYIVDMDFKLRVLEGFESTDAMIYVDGARYQFSNGMQGDSASSVFFDIDSIRPTVTISMTLDEDGWLRGTEDVEVTSLFTEAVKEFIKTDIIVDPKFGTIKELIRETDILYKAIFSPEANVLTQDTERAVISVGSASYKDMAGNDNADAPSLRFRIDTLDRVAPSPSLITLDDTQLAVGEVMLLTINFNERVVGFSELDISIDLALGSLGVMSSEDGRVYSVQFVPKTGVVADNLSFTIGTAYADLAGNAGLSASSPSFEIDTLAPTLSIEMNSATLVRGQTLALTFTFSEAVEGFTAADVLLDGLPINGTNGTLSEIVPDDTSEHVFHATYTPPAELIDATNIFSVAAGSFVDELGNAGTAAQSDNVSIDTVGKRLFGTIGNDLVVGTAGADRISGLPQSGEGAGKGTMDVLAGLGGADIFVLGSHSVAFYNDENNNSSGQKDFAMILDFSKSEGDKIQVKSGNYVFSALTISKLSGAGLYLDTNNSLGWDNKDELTGFLVGVAPESLSTATDLIFT